MTTIGATDLTGDWKQKLDGHLKADDFFGTAKFPTATLVFKKIGSKGNGVYTVTADLTIKGKTKSVTFDGSYKGTVKDAYGNTKAAFVATTTINRQDFGLTWSKAVEAGPVVGDKLTIELKIQAAKK